MTQRTCQADNCNRLLSSLNRHGFCQCHRHLSKAAKLSVKKARAKKKIA